MLLTTSYSPEVSGCTSSGEAEDKSDCCDGGRDASIGGVEDAVASTLNDWLSTELIPEATSTLGDCKIRIL